jgi:hypothetical protein
MTRNILIGKMMAALFICMTMMSCNGDSIPSHEVKRCTRVYILADDGMKREYQRFVPQARDWAYFVTEYGFQDGSTEHVYRYDHNIFINRRKSDVDHKIVTQKKYIASCENSRGRADTIYLMFDNGDTYSEYLVKERYDLVTEADKITIHNIFGDSELLVDFSMSQGQWTALGDDMRRIAVRKVSTVNCNLIHQVTRFHKLDSINESFIRGIGSMHRRTPKLDIRLKLINDNTIPAFMDELCE